MSTYIKGVTDVMPGPKTMAPDYGMLSTALSTLQNKYDRGFDQVKTMYNSLINSPLSSSDNEQFRSEYLKKADAALSKFSGVDLSNPNNVQQATNVFKPLVNDVQYSRDLYLTKTQDNEISKMLQVKNNTDEKIRTQYNPKMERWLMLGKERLGEMKRDNGSIERATSNSFTPWEDPIEFAMAKAKEQDLDITRETIEGFYFKKTKNGDQAYGPYKTWFNNVVGDRFSNQFRIEAELDHEDSVKGLMAQDKSLNRDSATQLLANEYSGRYVKQYNEQIDDLQSEVDEINLRFRTLKNTNTSGLSKAEYDTVMKLKDKRDNNLNLIKKLQTEKVDDATLQKKAVELYINNPAGTRVGAVKENYAKKFAYDQAYTNTSVDYTPNSVALQFQQQSFEWSKMLHQNEFQLGRDATQREFDLAKLQLTGEIKGGTGSANVSRTGPENVGEIPLQEVYKNTLLEASTKSVAPYSDNTVLAAAAGFTIKNGVVSTPAGTTFDLSKVGNAITKKSKGIPLSPPEVAQLRNYLNNVSPGSNYNDRNTISDVMSIIDQAVRTRKGQNPEYANVQSKLNIAAVSREQNNKLYYEENKHLSSLLTNPELSMYISRLNTGGYGIDYTAINKLDPEDQKYIYDQLIPKNNIYRSQTNQNREGVMVTASDPKKFDSSIWANAIENSEDIGVLDEKGVLQKFTPEQRQSFKQTVVGAGNLSQVFGTDIELHPKYLNGQWYVQATVPVNRTVTPKGSVSVATSMGWDPTENIAKTNKVEFFIPANKALSLGGNDIISTNPLTGQKRILPNNVKSELAKMVSGLTTSASTSWVSDYGFGDPNKRESPFPSYLQSKIAGGKVVGKDNDAIEISFNTNDGNVQQINFTEKNGISYSQYLNDKVTYDNQIQKYITDAVNEYDIANTKASLQKNTNNNLTTGKIPWSQIKLN